MPEGGDAAAPDVPTPDAAPAPARLDQVMVRGVAWTAVGRILSQLLRWSSTLLVARLLSPEDYGVMGIAAMVIEFAAIVAEFGFGAAIVQDRTLSREHVEDLGGAGLLLAIALAAACSLASPLVAAFFRVPALSLVVSALTLRLVLDAASTVPRSCLARDLRFKELAAMEGIEAFVSAALTLLLAWLLRSYWALAISNLVGGATLFVLAARAYPFRLRLPRSGRGIAAQVRFGRDVILGRLVLHGYLNADFAVVGRLFDKVALGTYTFGWNLASVPSEKLFGMLLRVIPGVLSAARARPDEMRRLYGLIVEGLALVLFPAAAGIALVADPFIETVVGAKWLPAAGPFRLLSLFFAVRAIAAAAQVVMVTQGAPHVHRNYSLVFLVTLPGLFVVGAHWGLTGVAAVWILAYPALFFALEQRWVLRSLGMRARAFFGCLAPAAACTALMSVVVLFTDAGLANGHPAPAVRLVVLVLAGAATYVGALRVLFPARFRQGLTLVRRRRFA